VLNSYINLPKEELANFNNITKNGCNIKGCKVEERLQCEFTK
jgi:hypothetical protein